MAWVPSTASGWITLVSTLAILTMLFVVLPNHLDAYLPARIPDSWISAVVGMLWVDATAALGLFAFVRRGERSIAALLALAASMSIGAFFTLSVVLGGLTGN